MSKLNRPPMKKDEAKLFDLAVQLVKKDPILRNQSSSMRRAWCEGFMNGKLYFDHKQPRRNFWQRLTYVFTNK
jgi:hypothetical protein